MLGPLARGCDLDGGNRELGQPIVHALRQESNHLAVLFTRRLEGIVGGDFLANVHRIEQLVVEVDDNRRPRAEPRVLARRQHLLGTSEAHEQNARVGGERSTSDTGLQLAHCRHIFLVGVTNNGRAFGVHDAGTAVLDDLAEQLRDSSLGGRVTAIDEDRSHQTQEPSSKRPAPSFDLGDEDHNTTQCATDVEMVDVSQVLGGQDHWDALDELGRPVENLHVRDAQDGQHPHQGPNEPRHQACLPAQSSRLTLRGRRFGRCLCVLQVTHSHSSVRFP